MSKQTIQLGTPPSGVGGDTPRSAFMKSQQNFDELYSALGASGTPLSLPATLPVANGGTGGATQATARAGLGLGSAAVAPIVGTVSQASSVPTGAIMERGSNANGEYVKYADGTMVCWGISALYYVTLNLAGAIYIANSNATFTFPAVFATFPRVSDASLFDHPLNGAAGVARGWGAPFAATKTTCQIGVYGHASNSAIWPGYIAIGRWY